MSQTKENQWLAIAPIEDIPVLGSRVVDLPEFRVAVFRGKEDQIYAIKDACPHKQGPLSQGIMHGTSVTCPLHSWKIDLISGEALGPDKGCTNVYETRVEEGMVFLQV